MNTADLCPRGRELKKELAKFNNTYQKFQRIHMLFMVMGAEQKYRQHVDECDYCKELADAVGSQD